MVDIHAHIIDSFDDGCKSLNEPLDLLKSAQQEGITDIIWTLHYVVDHIKYQNPKSESTQAYHDFKQVLKEAK